MKSIDASTLNPELLRTIYSNNRATSQTKNLKRINPKRLGDQMLNYLNLWDHPIPRNDIDPPRSKRPQIKRRETPSKNHRRILQWIRTRYPYHTNRYLLSFSNIIPMKDLDIKEPLSNQKIDEPFEFLLSNFNYFRNSEIFKDSLNLRYFIKESLLNQYLDEDFNSYSRIFQFLQNMRFAMIS